MSIELKMPALSPTMEKGTLAKWAVKVGDVVKPGDMLAEIETDKASMELEAEQGGRIAELTVAEGTDDIPVGAVIAWLTESGDAALAAPPIVAVARAAASPASAPKRAPRPALAEASVVALAVDEKVNATPLARRVAALRGIDLAGVRASGPHGRIVSADLGVSRALATSPPAVVSSAPAPSHPAPDGVPFERVKLSNMRKTIARRLTESKQTVPHFYLTARCNLDELLKQRDLINAVLKDRGVRLSVNDMLIKALGLAMQAVPEVNVQFDGDGMFRFSRVDISVAVAIDGGLVTPVIRDVGALSLSAIAQQSRTVAAKARDGGLQPEDYQGGTASISNLGMFGVDEIFPVLNPPQALILGVGAGVEQPWKVGDGIGLATIMSATASFDHRVIDGAIAARFMAALRDMIERPLQILS